MKKEIPCEYRGSNGVWFKATFHSRARQTATILITMQDGSKIKSKRSVFDVRINGEILPYKSRYEFTNRFNPF